MQCRYSYDIFFLSLLVSKGNLMLLSGYVNYMVCDVNYTVILSQKIRDLGWFDDRTASQTVCQHSFNNRPDH